MNVDAFFATLHGHAVEAPDRIAVDDGTTSLSYARLVWEIAHAVGDLERLGRPAVGLLARNGTGWAVADLAALCGGVGVVPLPGFFTDAQLRWLVERAGLAAIVTDDEPRARRLLPDARRRATRVGTLYAIAAAGGRHCEPCADKVTFTSGTTGRPKGVRLRATTLLTVAASLAQASGIGPDDRHVALLPLSVLLENVGGLYRGLIAGATVLLPETASTGTDGAARADGARVLDTLAAHGATSAILVPYVLERMVEALEAGATAPAALRFVGAGGAPVGAALLQRAWRHGLPVYEGYGLSEAASVVAVNTRGAARPGSVGRVLPHARVRIADDGEILVAGALLEGYLDDETEPRSGDWWPTGDLGRFDDDGFLWVFGRKRDAIVTAFGRNVAPAWVEGLLTERPSIAQAVVFGDGRPHLAAVLHSRHAADRVERDVLAVNAALPEYAQVVDWKIVDAPLPTHAGPDRAAPDGAARVDRDEVARRFADFLGPASPAAAPTAHPAQEPSWAFMPS